MFRGTILPGNQFPTVQARLLQWSMRLFKKRRSKMFEGLAKRRQARCLPESAPTTRLECIIVGMGTEHSTGQRKRVRVEPNITIVVSQARTIGNQS